MVERWEYKVIYFTAERWSSTGLPSNINEKLDEYGAGGWELVGTESIVRPGFFGYGSKTVSVVTFFKRRVGG
jgi:hypothetical protein